MAGPSNQQPIDMIIPAGEAQVIFSATLLARKILNFESTPEGTLRSVVGPTFYEPKRLLETPGSQFDEDQYQAVLESEGSSGSSVDKGHGIFHAGLLGGIGDTLIVRGGRKLYRHHGWSRSFEELTIPNTLTTEPRALYPDQFLVMNDKIIWTNGIDRALTISADGMVVPLGFAQVPTAPIVDGPQQPAPEDRDGLYPNSLGYSWAGGIGTYGDLLDGFTGAVRAGAWYYYCQYEDVHGNLSQPSAESNVVLIESIQADPLELMDDDATGAEIGDLTRQFMVRVAGGGPDHCVAKHIYRTKDTKNNDAVPQLVVRVPGKSQVLFSDTKADGLLGNAMINTVAVPVFRMMCTHQGRLVIANTPDDPGVVRRSQVGFPGTFERFDFIYPDSGGAEVTGVASHNGQLIAFTRTSSYVLQDFMTPIPLAQGVGCIAPRSIKALPDGSLIWLSEDGFYALRDNQLTPVSLPISRTLRHGINKPKASMAVAVVDPVSKEYRCALAPAGSNANSLLLTFNGANWKRQELGIDIADMCQTDDWRRYVLAVGKDPELDRDDVFVLGRETLSYRPNTRDIVYRSAWMKGNETGLAVLNVRSMYIGMLDAFDDEFEIRFYRNGSFKSVVLMTDVKPIGTDDGSDVVTDVAGKAKIGSAKTHDPRLFYRQVPVGLENVTSWAFEIRAKSPTRLHLAAFGFDVSIATAGNVRGRIPHRTDV